MKKKKAPSQVERILEHMEENEVKRWFKSK